MNTRTHPSPLLVCRSCRNTLRCQGFAASLPAILAASPLLAELSASPTYPSAAVQGRRKSPQLHSHHPGMSLIEDLSFVDCGYLPFL
ncbi:uncharacterized protein DS421_10g295730 [Arachis hypogaea]|nr:uncharacterized protein DS421_10g295730 [Arachis hypogaea]